MCTKLFILKLNFYLHLVQNVYINNLSHSFFFLISLFTSFYPPHLLWYKHFTYSLTLFDIIILRRYFLPFFSPSRPFECDRSAIKLVNISSHSEPIHTVNPVTLHHHHVCVCVCVACVACSACSACVCVCVSFFTFSFLQTKSSSLLQ